MTPGSSQNQCPLPTGALTEPTVFCGTSQKCLMLLSKIFHDVVDFQTAKCITIFHLFAACYKKARVRHIILTEKE